MSIQKLRTTEKELVEWKVWKMQSFRKALVLIGFARISLQNRTGGNYFSCCCDMKNSFQASFFVFKIHHSNRFLFFFKSERNSIFMFFSKKKLFCKINYDFNRFLRKWGWTLKKFNRSNFEWRSRLE